MSELNGYSSNTYSQSGEDGILAEIFDRLDVTEGTFCEFGAWDGKQLSNCYRLLNENGWQGVMIEADDEKFQALSDLAETFPNRLEAHNRRITPSGDDTLDSVLSESNIASELDLLSIDIDGADYFIWQSLTHHRPTVVVIEYNRCLGPDIRYASAFGPDVFADLQNRDGSGVAGYSQFDRFRAYGSSFRALVDLGESKNYNLVAATQQNLVFVAEDDVERLALPEADLTDPAVHWRDEWVGSEWCDPPVKTTGSARNGTLLADVYRIPGSLRRNGFTGTISRAIRKLSGDR